MDRGAEATEPRPRGGGTLGRAKADGVQGPYASRDGAEGQARQAKQAAEPRQNDFGHHPRSAFHMTPQHCTGTKIDLHEALVRRIIRADAPSTMRGWVSPHAIAGLSGKPHNASARNPQCHCNGYNLR